KKNPDWRFPEKISNHRIFIILVICKYCLSIIAPQSRWSDRLRILLKENLNIPRLNMGFPENLLIYPSWCQLETQEASDDLE
ncbi:hypothetical protein K8I31_19870, partial [bacterium]|nr:hypothetical protein [bacterium]